MYFRVSNGLSDQGCVCMDREGGRLKVNKFYSESTNINITRCICDKNSLHFLFKNTFFFFSCRDLSNNKFTEVPVMLTKMRKLDKL